MSTRKHMTFGRWLKRAIEDALMNQTQFAEAAGVTRNAVCKWVADDQIPSGLSVVRIARALGKTREEVESHLPQLAAA